MKKLYFIFLFVFHLVFSFNSQAQVNVCSGKLKYALEDLSFEEFLPNRYLVSGSYEKNEFPFAEIENLKNKRLLKIFIEAEDGICLLDTISLSGIKICSKGQWYLRKWTHMGSSGWSVIGKESDVHPDAEIINSSICGSVKIDALSKITNSTLHERSQIILPSNLRDGISEISNVINSTLLNVHQKGSIQSNNLSLSNANFNLVGDLVCDSSRCYYKNNPCSPKKLYAFPPVETFKLDSPWWDNFSLPMPQSGFSCHDSESTKEEFSSIYAVFPYPSAFWYSSASAPLEQHWPIPTLEYLGCTYDGTISKSLYRYITADPEFESIPQTEKAIVTSAFCTEQINPIQSIQNPKLTEVHRGSEKLNPGFITLRGAPYCYNYKIIQFNHANHRVVSDLEVKYEECSDCGIGQVKINEVCTCPEGYQSQNNSCKKTVACNSRQDYWNKNCSCAKPYLYLDVNGREYYSCSVPENTSDWQPNAVISDPEVVTGIFTNLGCHKLQGTSMVQKFKYRVQKSPAVVADLVLFCKGKRGLMRNGSSAEPIMRWFVGESDREVNFEVPVIGDCYDYKLRLMDWSFPNYYWQEHDLKLDYLGCQTK